MLDAARILVVEDDRDTREMLSEWLNGCGCQVSTASNGHEALELLSREAIEVVVTDLSMPGLTGLQLLSMIKLRDHSIEVIMLTGQATIDDAIAALRECRAFDFLQKPLRDLNELSSSIEGALERRRTRVVEAKPKGDSMRRPAHVETLSQRELEVVRLLEEGLENRGIAERLVLSEKTVQNHLTRIYDKLRVTNRIQAVVTCQRYGLI